LPPEVLERDWSETYRASEAVEAAWAEVYRDTARWWPFYQLAEKLVDVDDAFATWRHKHSVTVERIIGMKMGTGGTPGVAYLQSTIAKRAFPELWSLRTLLRQGGPSAGQFVSAFNDLIIHTCGITDNRLVGAGRGGRGQKRPAVCLFGPDRSDFNAWNARRRCPDRD
jgi:hypothetical protein